MAKTIVIALGGNAILQDGEQGTAAEQLRNIESVCTYLVPLVRDEHRLILTHGNGPQVGNLLIQQEEAEDIVPMQPLDICVGMTQGQIGTMLQQALTNALREAGIQRDVVTVISHFLVSADDPDFQILSKPVGPFMGSELKERYEQRGHTIREIRKGHERPYRRCVASPAPLRLLEKRALKLLSDSGAIVIAAGGGGIPVTLDAGGSYRKVESVIDKDLAGEKLAESVSADIYLILTNVDKVALNYGTDRQEELHRVTVSDARRYYQEGHFASGSMGPKVLSCIDFIEFGGEVAIITGFESAARAINFDAGTRIVPDG
ncbi:MAG: carbamate kinase [Chloroflexi bacterium]|nr:carbamate kinase [Chloroflexota bacterium]